MRKFNEEKLLDETAHGRVTRKKQPFFDEKSPLADVPKWWLDFIEWRLPERDPVTKCWLLHSCLDKDGYPYHAVRKSPTSKKTSSQRLKNFIASKFWDFGKWASLVEIIPKCGNRNCINPAHLGIRFDHHSQRR